MKSVFFLPVFLFLAPVGCENRKIEFTEPSAGAETSRPAAAETPQAEPAKEKAVRLAEDFIRRNGYTTAPADKENFSPETVEFYDSIDDLLKERYNTLDGKAYGVSPHGKGSRKGWTVVFRYSEKSAGSLKNRQAASRSAARR